MPIPLRFTVPDRGAGRYVAPLIFVVVGVGIVAWFHVQAPYLVGWQRYVPYVMGGFFVVAGIGRLIGAVRRQAAREADQRALEEHRDAPWRVRPEWRSDELTARGGLEGSFVALAVFWNVFSWPLAILLVRGEEGAGDPAVWLVFLFPLIGLGMLAKVALEVLRMRKYGRTAVALDPMPMRLGRPFRGTLRVKLGRDARPEGGFLVKVSCYRQRVRYTRDSDGDRSRKIVRDLLWRDETRCRDEPTVDGTRVEVPFAFDLPGEVPASTPLKLDNRIVWEIAAEADVPGIDFDARVEVPVFPPEEGAVEEAGSEAKSISTAQVVDDDVSGAGAAALGAARSDAAWAFDQPLTEGIELIDEPDLFELHFTAARKRKGALLLGLFGVVFLVAGVPIVTVSGLVGLIFVAMGAFLVYGAVQQGTNDTVLRVAEGRVEVTHDGIGMPADVAFPAAQVDEVLVHLGTRSSENARYAIALVARAGEGLEHLEEQADKVVGVLSRMGMEEDHPAMEAMRQGADRPRIAVADDFADKDEADWLASRIREAVAREGERG